MAREFWGGRGSHRKAKAGAAARKHGFPARLFESLEPRLMLSVNTVSGDLPAGTTTWVTGDIQHVTGNVRVPTGSTLVIQPGAVVKFDNNTFSLLVEGGFLFGDCCKSFLLTAEFP